MTISNHFKPFQTLLCLLLLVSCGKQAEIVVSNPTLEQRYNQVVEIPLTALGLPESKVAKLALYNEQGAKVAFQIMHGEEQDEPTLLFLVDTIRGGMNKTYTLKRGSNKTKITPYKIVRKSHRVLWENDYAIFSMADDGTAAISLWLKRQSAQGSGSLIEQFFTPDGTHLKRITDGLDCFDAGITGCGQLAYFEILTDEQTNTLTDEQSNTQTLQPMPSMSFRVIDEGALAMRFALENDLARLTVTSYRALPFCKADIMFKDDADTLRWVAGVSTGERVEAVAYSEQGGWLSYGSDAVSEQGVHYGKQLQAVVMPRTGRIAVTDHTLYAHLPNYQPQFYIYYFGGAWSLSGFEKEGAWGSTVATFAHDIQQPLTYKVRSLK